MKRYTDEDVEALVKAMRLITRALDSGIPVNPDSINHDEARWCLKPFLPDPEDELVEAMAKAAADTGQYTGWEGMSERMRREYRKEQRSILTLLKDRGLLKDLT